jgi:Na+-translocating ferredoxin:NAD+ oxidoreductase subunit B
VQLERLRLILFLVARKFNVIEDPRIDKVEEELPGANCGGCGLPGCRAFAEALVKADDISVELPGQQQGIYGRIALYWARKSEKEPLVAVVRCADLQAQREKNKYI